MDKKRELKNLSREIAQKFKLENNTLSRDVKKNSKDRIQLEIGDSKQADFMPQAKIMRWDNEVNFSLRYKDEEAGDPEIETEGKVLRYKKEKVEFHAYELDPSELGEDGGLEIELLLKEKPDTNKFDFTLQTKGLNFYYQPALTEKEIEEGASRPENVVGSYAVYHATKGGLNRADGMEYKTGKAFHIFRPKVTDAKGNETWGELNIDEEQGILSVTVDNDWLDKAVYPVVVDPTFGYTSLGGSSFNIGAGDLGSSARQGNWWTSPEAGNITQISTGLALNAGSESITYSSFINEENSGGAGVHDEIVSVEETGVGLTTSIVWRDVATSPTPFNASTNYIFTATGNWGTAGTRRIQLAGDITSANEVYTKSFNDASNNPAVDYANAKEDPFTDTRSASLINFSIYATYTAAASPPSVKDAVRTDADFESSITITFSNTPTDDDVLYAMIFSSEIPSGVPSGWTLLLQEEDTTIEGYISLYRKVASSEAGAGYTWTGVGIAGGGIGINVENASTSVPEADFSHNQGDSNSIVHNSVDAANDDTLLLALGMSWTGFGSTTVYTPPSGFEEHLDDSDGTFGFFASSDVQESAGASGNKTTTSISGDEFNAILIAINPSTVSSSLPIVNTSPISNIEQHSAQGNGSVASDGGSTITRRGFVYGTSSESDPEDTDPDVSDYDSVVDESGSFGEESFDLLISGLLPNRTYYVRAFAENSDGFAYGDEVNFTTDQRVGPFPTHFNP